MYNILVTGGAGFIGSNLCEAMLCADHNVVCLDNFATGKRENICTFMDNPRFKLINGDIRNLSDCQKAVNGVDYVLHEAALGSVPRSIKEPTETNEVNIGGFMNMLIAARDAKVKRFIYASSSSVYGNLETLPSVEDMIGKPYSPYAVTKYANELYADVFFRTYGLESIGLRYFNVFGRRQDAHSVYTAVIPLFVKQFINHQSPIINGDGERSRDFTYIDNVIQMNLLALETTNVNSVNTVYNTAYGEKTTLIQLIEYLKEYLSKYDPEIASIDVIFGPERVGDVTHTLASIDKAKELLGYNPKFNVRDGLKETINWYWNDREKRQTREYGVII